MTASHAPYKWDYWPHDDVRAECRFVGLTNLGATCYLASTIQQLYMIPEARQAVFTAKVSPLNTVLLLLSRCSIVPLLFFLLLFLRLSLSVFFPLSCSLALFSLYISDL